MSVFGQVKTTGHLYTEVSGSGELEWEDADKSLHVGHTAKESIHSYNNIIIKTIPSETTGEFLSKLEIDLTHVDSADGDLIIKLRKVQICDDNGKNGYVYMLCSEAFGGDSGFVPPSGLEAE
jgi:hypothetical protein